MADTIVQNNTGAVQTVGPLRIADGAQRNLTQDLGSAELSNLYVAPLGKTLAQALDDGEFLLISPMITQSGLTAGDAVRPASRLVNSAASASQVIWFGRNGTLSPNQYLRGTANVRGLGAGYPLREGTQIVSMFVRLQRASTQNFELAILNTEPGASAIKTVTVPLNKTYYEEIFGTPGLVSPLPDDGAGLTIRVGGTLPMLRANRPAGALIGVNVVGGVS